MGRWISADYIKAVMKGDRLMQGNCEYELWKQEVDRQVNAMPYIDLDDYVPKDFHDKTCEAMAKAHQEEIADMVRVADRPQGEWIYHKEILLDEEYYPSRFECDQCHHYVIAGNDRNFCPNCGARMKGADDEWFCADGEREGE